MVDDVVIVRVGKGVVLFFSFLVRDFGNVVRCGICVGIFFIVFLVRSGVIGDICVLSKCGVDFGEKFFCILFCNRLVFWFIMLNFDVIFLAILVFFLGFIFVFVFGVVFFLLILYLEYKVVFERDDIKGFDFVITVELVGRELILEVSLVLFWGIGIVLSFLLSFLIRFFREILFNLKLLLWLLCFEFLFELNFFFFLIDFMGIVLLFKFDGFFLGMYFWWGFFWELVEFDLLGDFCGDEVFLFLLFGEENFGDSVLELTGDLLILGDVIIFVFSLVNFGRGREIDWRILWGFLGFRFFEFEKFFLRGILVGWCFFLCRCLDLWLWDLFVEFDFLCCLFFFEWDMDNLLLFDIFDLLGLCILL